MKVYIYSLIVWLSLSSCADEPLSSNAEQSDSASTTSKATVTGLTRFKAANLAISSGGVYDGKRFYTDGSLRANNCYYPYSIKTETYKGYPRVRFYVKPTEPAASLVGTLYPFHHRAEFSRYPWKISLPVGTEEWLGFSYLFPTAAESFTQNQTPVSIYQNHQGRTPGQPEYPPALQLEIAYPNQLRVATDPSFYTPLGGEIMIINNVRGIRFVAPGVRVVAGARLNIVMQIVYGQGDQGLFNVWINGKLIVFQGNAKAPAGNKGSTVWPPYLSTDQPVGGNSKLGLYHHQLRFQEYVTLNAKKGHTHMRVWMTDWNDLFRKPTDWDYKNMNAYSAVDTSTYP